MPYFANAGQIVIHFVFALALLPFVARVLLRAVRANFYNPICQFIYRITNPVLLPWRKFVPHFGRWDVAAALVAWLIACIKSWLLITLFGKAFSLPATLVFGFTELVDYVLGIYLFLIFVRVILSFVNPSAYHPAMPLLEQLTDPVLKPFRRLLPNTGPIDLSPLLALLSIYLARALIVAPLNDLGRMLAR